MRTVRERLDHPVIDVDSHSLEFTPVVHEYLAEIGSPELVDRLRRRDEQARSDWSSFEERRNWRVTRGPWWSRPAENTLDRATAMLPGLLAERLEEIGLDHSIVYPTMLGWPIELDDELRQVGCRAVNTMRAELFRAHADRLTPVALIPVHTPEEAIAELDHVVLQLGMPAITMPSYVLRPIPGLGRTGFDDRYAGPLGDHTRWIDNLVIDSPYDYDPLWARCDELGVVPTFHSPGMSWGGRVAMSNYVYNHLGHFAAGGEVICKALFLGGVTRRFPRLHFAFLEGGVGWACNLFADIVGHWEKRNGSEIRRYDPARRDRALLHELFRKYPSARYLAAIDQLDRSIDGEALGGPLGDVADDPAVMERADPLDEFDAAGVSSVEDIVARFATNFYFGCEADDPMTALAFDGRFTPRGVGLRAIFSSDIGHWDVPDMRGILAEAYEPVEDGLLSEDDFRRFTFEYPAALYTVGRPDFFAGTSVADAVAAITPPPQVVASASSAPTR